MKSRRATRGRFIVIDGIDGTGKATQTALLVGRLKREGQGVKAVTFPNYYQSFFGKLLGEYLSGRYGDFIEVDPHIASVLYAADRFESGPRIRRWLETGHLVIADRYVSANQIHQGSKIDDPEERSRFLRWLDRMEYGVFKIPRPDLIIYLDLPVALSQKLLKSKLLTFKKRYTGGRPDVAEDNLRHLESSRRGALKLIRRDHNWQKICCDHAGAVRPREEIHELIYRAVTDFLA